MCFLHGLSCGSPYAVCVLVESFFSVSDIVFAELSVSETLSPHRLSFGLPSAVLQFQWQKRPRLLPVGPQLGRSMRWYLLLIWVQGLRQAPPPASGKAQQSSLDLEEVEEEREAGSGRGSDGRKRMVFRVLCLLM